MTTLLESKARPFGSSKGVALSMVVHGVVVAAVILFTAKAVLPPPEKVEEHPVLYVASPPPPPVVAPKTLPVVKAPPKAAAPRKVFVAPTPKAAPQPAVPKITVPAKLALSIPAADVKLAPVAIDMSPAIAEPAREPAGGSAAKSGDAETSGRSTGGLGSGSEARAFSEDQVERTAEVTRRATPHYPDALRSVSVEGEVVMQFIVGTDGKVEPGSMEVKSSPNKLFSDAVRAALMNTRYRPAEVGGKPVRQLVQQAFTFSLTK